MDSSLSSVRLDELPWTDVAAYLERDGRLIVPVGTCDQYGPHLPLGAGTRVAESLADDLAREFGVLRAPTFHYGVNVPSELEYAGTAALRGKTLHRVLNELLACWAAQGFRELIALTADLHDPHVEAIATVAAPNARLRVVEALSVDLSQFLEGEPGPQHGGEALTSLLLHLRPELVRLEEARDFEMDAESFHRFMRGRLPRLPRRSRGAIGHPTFASAEKGRAIYLHVLEKIRARVFRGGEPPVVEARAD